MGTEVIAIVLFTATLVGGVLLWELRSHRHRRRRRLLAVLVVAAGAVAALVLA